MNINNLRIGQKLQFYILTASIIVFIVAIGYISTKTKNNAMDDSTDLVISYSDGYASKIERLLNTDMSAVRTLANAFNVHQNLEIDEWKPLFREMNEHVMLANPGFHSLWDSWEYNYIDPEWDIPYGRQVSIWWRENSQLRYREVDRGLDGDSDINEGVIKTDRESIGEPSFDNNRNRLITILTAPLFYNNNHVGNVGVEVDLNQIQDNIRDINVFYNDHAYLVSNEGYYAAHSNTSVLNYSVADHLSRDAQEQNIIRRIQAGESFSYISQNHEGENYLYSYHPVNIGNTNTPWSFAIAVPVSEMTAAANKNITTLIFIGIIGVIVIGLIIYVISGKISKPLQQVTYRMKQLSQGHIDKSMKLTIKTNDEIEEIVNAFNVSIDGLLDKTNFATKIGKGNLNSEMDLLSDKDILGKALIEMRDNLIQATDEDKKRKEEDSKRNWANEGFTLFADILRQSDNDLKILSENVINKLVKYLDANQGGLFILNDDNENEKFLELNACYAFDRKKYLEKKINIGEGLVGACFVEQKTTYMTDIPNDYINITSGLGGENPRSLLIVPLKLNEEVLGVIEIASFNQFEQYQIDFVEKIAESIASSISSVKINAKTAYLLEQSQQQAEEMRAQEEEMRQNMEELQATQEGMERKQAEQDKLQEELKQEQALLHAILENIPDYIYFKDTNCRFLRVSKSMVGLINAPGCETPEDLIGMSDFDFHTKKAAQERYDAEQAIMKGTEPPMIDRVDHELLEDGREQWVSSTKMPLKDKDGKVIGLWGISKLITDVKKAEIEAKAKGEEADILDEKLKICENEHKSLLTALNSNTIMIEYSPDGSVIKANKAAQELFSTTENKIKGTKHSELLKNITKEKLDKDSLWNDLGKGIVKQRTFKAEIDKKSVTINETCSPVADNKGNLVKVIAVLNIK